MNAEARAVRADYFAKRISEELERPDWPALVDQPHRDLDSHPGGPVAPRPVSDTQKGAK
jgi:hypothetical protein